LLLLLGGGVWFTAHLEASKDRAEREKDRAEQRERDVVEARDLEKAALRQRVLAQVDQLRTADPQAVPAILEGLAPDRAEVLPRLRELWEEPEPPGHRRERMRVGLALLPAEPDRVKGPLFAWLLEADDPREVVLTRDTLRPYAAEQTGGLWQKADAADTPAPVRFRALVALAAFDPDSPHWQQANEAVLGPLLLADPLHLGTWAEALRPVSPHLVGPLAEVFRSHKYPEQRVVAATLLAGYAAGQPALLTDLALDADDRQYITLLPALVARRGDVLPLLHAELKRKAPAKATEAERDALAYRQCTTWRRTASRPGACWRGWSRSRRSRPGGRCCWRWGSTRPSRCRRSAGRRWSGGC
jgi:hypothetical protein